MNNYEQDTSMVPYASQSVGGLQERMIATPTLKTRLENAVRQAEERLAEARHARELFDKHPDLEEILNIMQKGRF